MTNRTEFKRRTVFIKRAFQGRFVAWVLAMIVLAGVSSGVLLYFLLSSDLGSGMQSAHLRLEDTWQRLGISILAGNIIAAIIAGLAASLVVVQITHKIAGPLYRLQTVCEEIARGNLTVATNLRSDDELHDLASAFGAMVETLRARRDVRHTRLAEARNTLAKLRAGETGGAERETLCASLEQQLVTLAAGD